MEFLGHARGQFVREKRNDLKRAYIDDCFYQYSLDSDSESCAAHALEMHFQDSQKTLTEEMIADVAHQLGVDELANEIEEEITRPELD